MLLQSVKPRGRMAQCHFQCHCDITDLFLVQWMDWYSSAEALLLLFKKTMIHEPNGRGALEEMQHILCSILRQREEKTLIPIEQDE